MRELADQGWANTRIAKEIGSTAATVNPKAQEYALIIREIRRNLLHGYSWSSLGQRQRLR